MRQLLRDLATPRYAALTALMVVVAAICVVCGTWQIARYESKHVANTDLRGNAHDAAVAVGTVLPVQGTGPAPTQDGVEFRSVSATGTYDAADQLLVRRQQVNDTNGFYVLTPLRTDGPVLLVVRGFVPDTGAGDLRPDQVPAPPSGTVTVTGRVQLTQDADDRFGVSPAGQVDVVNVASAAKRLGAPTYAGWVQLDAGQPGTSGITALPAPDLSNPAGGAFELQHLAYIVQWYLFAGLALAAPLVMVRTDHRRARADAAELAATLAIAEKERPMSKALVPVDPKRQAQTTEQRLAQRYGR